MSEISLSFEHTSSARTTGGSQRPRSLSTGTNRGDTATKYKLEDKQRLVSSSKQQQQQQSNPNRYKTEFCRPFQEYGHCRYGDKCQFAHGKDDLRTPIRHPKYKTEYCRTYHSQGYCPYGARCHFVHSTVEARPIPPPVATGVRPLTSGVISPSIQTNFLPFMKPPSSPSQDSGISSPEGTPTSFGLAAKAFEYPSFDGSMLPDDQEIDYRENTWKTNEMLLSGDWDSLSNDEFSPIKDQFDDLTEKLSSTSLDDGCGLSYRTRLPIFNQLNSFSDTALSSW